MVLPSNKKSCAPEEALVLIGADAMDAITSLRTALTDAGVVQMLDAFEAAQEAPARRH